MNRIEKLLFSKRSPLRRALVDETSREERLKLLPDIAREMRKAGLISRDFELEAAGLNKRNNASDILSYRELVIFAGTALQRDANSGREVTNAPAALADISLNYFCAVIYFVAGLHSEMKNSLEIVNALQRQLISLLGTVGAFRPAKAVPIAGFLFELSNGFQVSRATALARDLRELFSHEVDIRQSFGVQEENGRSENNETPGVNRPGFAGGSNS